MQKYVKDFIIEESKEQIALAPTPNFFLDNRTKTETPPRKDSILSASISFKKQDDRFEGQVKVIEHDETNNAGKAAIDNADVTSQWGRTASLHYDDFGKFKGNKIVIAAHKKFLKDQRNNRANG